MFAGIIAGVTWAIETIILGIALAMSPFCSTEQAVILAPFASTFLHDLFSAVWSCIYNGVRGNLGGVIKALKTKSGKYVSLAAVIGGPVGMTGYVLSVANMGASIGAVASAIFPAIGAVLAYFFLKEKMSWYRWVFLIVSLLGVYGLSYSPELNITNFWLGFVGTLMCAFGWGIEAVIIAKCVQDNAVTDEIALQIRQTTSAIVYGVIILPIMKGWGFTLSLFNGTGWLIPVIAIAALFAFDILGFCTFAFASMSAPVLEIPAWRNSFMTVSVGCAPLASHFLTASAFTLTVPGFVFGSYVPTCSIKRPSTGLRESDTTIL